MKNIINQVQSGWSKDLIIRFLYIKLAPYFQRDLLFFLVSDDEKEAQYRQGFINRFPHVVCSTLADFYVDLFRQYGIDAKKVMANSAKIPLFGVIVQGDYGWYYLDPLSDLLANQYGLRPYFFGIIPHYNTIRSNHPELIKLPYEYVDELDGTLKINYLDDFFENLHHVLTNKKSAAAFFGFSSDVSIDLKDRKLQFYGDELINLGNVNGPFERAQLYKFLNDRILNRGEKRHTCVRIADWMDNPHVAIETEDYDKISFWEEEKRDGVYVLTKKRVKSKIDI